MTLLPFLKMQAQGNDFVILDSRSRPLPALASDQIRQLADRRFGIGCDQVLILSPDGGLDARLAIFNSDGSQAESCGNGLRCVGELLLGESGKEAVRIGLADRMVRAERSEFGVRVHMGQARITGNEGAWLDIDMGNPHRVYFASPDEVLADRNVEIIRRESMDDIHIEVIERGSGPTPACGTGACAAAVGIWTKRGGMRPVTIHMPGGEVRVSGDMSDLVLEGPVAWVFRGEYALP